MRGRYIVTLNLIQSRIVKRIVRDRMVFNCPSAGASGSEAGVTTKQIPYGILPIPTFPNQGKERSPIPGLEREQTTASSFARRRSILSSKEFTFLNQKSNFSKYIFFIYT